MKLLIVTQKVDRQDPILGFFHAWIAEFATRCDRVTVIAQSVGAHSLPENVTVISLKKNEGRSVVSQIMMFWRIVWRQRQRYNRVLVHMTPIWVLIGAPMWLLLRKPMYLWYEIKRGSWKLTTALCFVQRVFAASEHGLPAVAKKQVIVGHGIDTAAFYPDASKREPRHLVAVGRLTNIKQYDVLLRALSALPDCHLTIAGGPVTAADRTTEVQLRQLMQSLGVVDRVHIGWVSPTDVPQLLQRADCMLHASQGGLDKAVLQAMACECPVVSTSEAAQSVLPPQCHATNDTMAAQTEKLLALSARQRQSLGTALRVVVEQDHSLAQCIDQLVSHMQ